MRGNRQEGHTGGKDEASDRRYHKLDGLRGLTLLSMIGYHGTWDLVYLFGAAIPWYEELPGFLWQQSICWTFILLSGFCWSLGRKHLKRGLAVFLAGAAITAATFCFMREAVIFFGVLTLIGSGMLVLIPLQKVFRRIPAAAGCLGSFFLFLITRWADRGFLGWPGILELPLPSGLYRNYFTAWLGFPFAGFFSTDYFPLIPWLFLYFTGYFLYRIPARLPRFLKDPLILPLERLGKHSLIVYIIHQPVLYLLLNLLFRK